MNCIDVEKLLSAYMDRQLPVWQKAAVTEHAEECSACHAELSELLELKQILRAHALPGLPASVRTAILAETVQTSPWRNELRAFRWGVPALALAAALGGWLILQRYEARLSVHVSENLQAYHRGETAKRDLLAWRRTLDLSTDSDKSN